MLEKTPKNYKLEKEKGNFQQKKTCAYNVIRTTYQTKVIPNNYKVRGISNFQQTNL